MSQPKMYARRLVAQVGTKQARLTCLMESTRSDKPAFWLSCAQHIVHMESEARIHAKRSRFTLPESEKDAARREYEDSRRRMIGYRDTTLLDG